MGASFYPTALSMPHDAGKVKTIPLRERPSPIAPRPSRRCLPARSGQRASLAPSLTGFTLNLREFRGRDTYLLTALGRRACWRKPRRPKPKPAGPRP
jgi:hypothetical protein